MFVIKCIVFGDYYAVCALFVMIFGMYILAVCIPIYADFDYV